MKCIAAAGLALAGLLWIADTAQAQVPVFRCEVDGRQVWSDKPCKGKGKVVNVRPNGQDRKKKPQYGTPPSSEPVRK